MKIFLSMASEEFSELRKQIRDSLARAGHHVIFQDDFGQSPFLTLKKLAVLIEGCTAVIHVAGYNLGSNPSRITLREISEDPEISKIYQQIAHLESPLPEITYTQWEAFFSYHFSIPILFYTNVDSIESWGVLHRDHFEWIRARGRYPEVFSSESDLLGMIYGDVANFREIQREKRWTLDSSCTEVNTQSPLNPDEWFRDL